MSKPLSFRWDENFTARVDAKRGAVSRSAYVRRAVEAAMESEDDVVASAVSPELVERIAERTAELMTEREAARNGGGGK
jgi:hypothetical protein